MSATVSLKFHQSATKPLKQLLVELHLASTADVVHFLLARYELPDPRPQPPASSSELTNKAVYEADHKQLRLLKYALGFTSYADVLDELLRDYLARPAPAPAPLPDTEPGEVLFTKILAMLERKRKRKRAEAKAAREASS